MHILIPCVRGFLRRLLRDAETSGSYRPLLNALKQVLVVTSNRTVIKCASNWGFDLASALPIAELGASRELKLVNFMTKQVPKWRQAMQVLAS